MCGGVCSSGEAEAGGSLGPANQLVRPKQWAAGSGMLPASKNKVESD